MSDPQGPGVDLPGRRERKKNEVRAALAGHAMTLFAERGYDQVSVEDIAEAADVSRTTFFRYYPTKEDVLVQWMRDVGDEAAQALVDRPPDEAPLTALRLAVRQLAEIYGRDQERADLIERLRRESPSVQSAYRDKLGYWEQVLTAAIARRTDLDPGVALYPRLTARLSMAVISSVSDTWVAGGQAGDVSELLDRAFDVIDESEIEAVLASDRASAEARSGGNEPDPAPLPRRRASPQ